MTEAGADSVFLDHTAFYPTSGGQPFDTGTIGGVAVRDVVDEDGRIRHLLAGPAPSGEVECAIDWTRRFDHMQQHTGQHLLSAVLEELFRLPTVSFHLGAEACTIDVEAAKLEPKQVEAAEQRVAEVVYENRPVTVSYHDAAEGAALGLRKASEREGTLRVVSIEGIDRSACGGTHVQSTAEIGPVLLRKLDKIRGNVRIEFYCGLRALALARTERESILSQLSTQAARLADADKTIRRLSTELATVRGRQLHADTAPSAGGLRVHVREIDKGPIGDDVRAEAQAFTALGGAVYAALCKDPASILVCTSADSPLKAGPAVKPLLEAEGGRGGGSPAMAQGSVPDAAALARVWAALQQKLA